MSEERIRGDKYIPFDERTSGESVVYFTRDLSGAGLKKIYERVNENISGKVAIKLHTGENDDAIIKPNEAVMDLTPFN